MTENVEQPEHRAAAVDAPGDPPALATLAAGSSEPHRGRERLLGIQFARGIAALLVVIYHGSRMVSLPQYAGHTGFGGFFEFGYAGVDFFFVLSGFIIYFVHRADLGKPQSLLRYGWRRITRIYPNYWLVLSVVVLLMVARHDPGLTVQHFYKSFFLLPDDREPLLGVAWTLVHEMLFYTVFALGILNLRLGLVVASCWVALILAGVVGVKEPLLAFASSTLDLEFLMGITAALVVLHVRVPFAGWLAGAGIVALLAAGLAENATLIGWASTSSHMIFGVCAAMVIVGIAVAERQGTFRVGRIGEFSGGASYLLYLVHTVAIGFTYQVLRLTGLIQRLPDWISVLVASAAAVAVAALLYRFFDLPVQAILNRIGRTRIFARG